MSLSTQRLQVDFYGNKVLMGHGAFSDHQAHSFKVSPGESFSPRISLSYFYKDIFLHLLNNLLTRTLDRVGSRGGTETLTHRFLKYLNADLEISRTHV